MHVTTGGFEAEYGQALGGMIRAITKSGGNTLSGDVFAYVTSRDLEGDRRELESPVGEINVAQDGFQQEDVGFTLV